MNTETRSARTELHRCFFVASDHVSGPEHQKMGRDSEGEPLPHQVPNDGYEFHKRFVLRRLGTTTPPSMVCTLRYAGPVISCCIATGRAVALCGHPTGDHGWRNRNLTCCKGPST